MVAIHPSKEGLGLHSTLHRALWPGNSGTRTAMPFNGLQGVKGRYWGTPTIQAGMMEQPQ